MTAGALLRRYGLPPAEIEQRSLGHIDATVGVMLPDGVAERAIARRIVYAGGDLSLVPLIRFAPNFAESAIAALRGGCRLVTDVNMVATALNRRTADRLGCSIVTAIDEPKVAELARASGWPRAAEAMHWLADRGRLDGAGVIIGNAPTALLALLDCVDAGEVRPAFIIGMPVGFVAATESKAELATRSTPWATIAGPRGGSPLAAAAANALLALAGEPLTESR